MEFAAMVFLLAVLVVALLGGFFFAWKRDQDRSEEVADDPERLHTETDPDPSTTTRHGRGGR